MDITRCKECNFFKQTDVDGYIVWVCGAWQRQLFTTDGFCHLAETSEGTPSPSKPRKVRGASRKGKEFLHRRLALGLTQVEVAEMLGCSNQSISQIEKGKSKRGAIIGALAELYDSLEGGVNG